jgi:hypothetical protein
MRKDFNEAYAIQKELFTKASKALTDPSIDKAQSFLLLPQKEFLALDRTARATFLTRFGNPEQAKNKGWSNKKI